MNVLGNLCAGALWIVVGCSDSGDVEPEHCETDSCNESRGGGTCDDASGSAVCTCNAGYTGSSCRQCTAGYHPDGDGGCVPLGAPPCEPLPGGATGEVQTPVLRQTLPASWDENWFASPAVADLELIVSLEDTLGGAEGRVQIWDLDGSASNCLQWTTGRGGLLRQGYSPL